MTVVAVLLGVFAVCASGDPSGLVIVCLVLAGVVRLIRKR